MPVRRLALAALASAVSLGAVLPAAAQQPAAAAAPKAAPAPRRGSPYAAEATLTPEPAGAVAPYDSTAFAALKWRELGPFRGGRSVAVAGAASRPMEYWFGTTGGGVYKTVDGGNSWTPMSDKYFGGTIGAIGVSESNPDVVYVGTGEYPIRGNVSHGDGVFRTADGGKTWSYVGLRDSRQISRVRVDPKDPNTVYVGAQGHVWAPNAERGVYKTTDGGKTWNRILFRNDSTGISDLVMDPRDPRTLYAAFWQAGRTPWMLVSGGAGSGIFKTVDAGAHWTEITRNPGLPAGVIGNVGLAVSAAKPGRVWAIVEADSGGVFRSDDAGRTWTRTNDDRKLRQRAWYYSRIFTDPRDSNAVYVLNTGMYRSTDAGKTFKNIPVPHGDNHDLWIAGDDPKRMIEANDGGANVSMNAGVTWTDQDQPTAQFYHVVTTNHYPYHVCGAQQDNSTLCGPSRWAGGIGMSEWHEAGGGESGYIAARPDEPDVVFAGSYGGLLTRKDMRTGFERDVNPWPDNPMGHDAADAKYRFQWTFPIELSPHDPNTIYVGSNVLFRTTNEGQRYEPISGDLTRHDPRTLGASGGPITKDQTSVEYYGTIFAVAESPVQQGVIWTGSDDGVIHLSRDAGKSWTNVTPPSVGEWARISSIEPSHTRAGTAYVASNRFQLDDMTPYLWKTTDYGVTWTRITTGLPADQFTRVLREDPVKPGLLYAGTERGVWVSFNDGGNWQPLQMNLPQVPVHDLAVANGDLVAATHGRAFWVLDDLSALRQMTPAVTATLAHLFRPRDAYRSQWGGGGGTAARPTAKNPPSGAVVYYWLKEKNADVTLDVMDAGGRVIRSFTSRQDSLTARDSVRGLARADSVQRARTDSLAKLGLKPDTAKVEKQEARGEETDEEEGPRRVPRPPRVANKAGLNTFVWNTRYPDATSFDDLILWAGGTQGPLAPPGTYRVRLTTAGVVDTASFVLRADPRSRATAADYREQFALLLRIRDRVSEANEAVRTVRSIRAQLADRRAHVPDSVRVRYEVLSSALDARIGGPEQAIYQTKNRASQDPLNYPIRLNNKISALAGVVASTDARPTDQSYTVLNVLQVQLDQQLIVLRDALRDLLPQVNALLVRSKLAPIVPDVVQRTESRPIADDEDDAEEKGARW